MSHKTGKSDETCHFGGGAALFSIAFVAASQRSTNGSQLVRRSDPELEGQQHVVGKATQLNDYEGGKRKLKKKEKGKKGGVQREIGTYLSWNRTDHLTTPSRPKSVRERGLSSCGSHSPGQAGYQGSSSGLPRPLDVDPPFKTPDEMAFGWVSRLMLHCVCALRVVGTYLSLISTYMDRNPTPPRAVLREELQPTGTHAFL
ncbi:unnamed protein product [Fusarium venenatum]|uniref:Uncharacterized protein n=1 Tax=Fusarium venenatum TaxID=56646 RepID=A0A2L2TNP7_9HYPO|nr:uncharacterized protein FVRRES_02919 [Fusarium venenatum]CEI66407.1 unnamed protein product [Fusarium venenatum]